MSKHIVSLKEVRKAVRDFMESNRHQISLFDPTNNADRVSIETSRQKAIGGNSEEKARYVSDVKTTEDVIVASMVQVALYSTFNTVASSYDSAFTEVIRNMILPTKTAFHDLVDNQISEDARKSASFLGNGDNAICLDDGIELFDPLYMMAVDMLSKYNFDPNSTVDCNNVRGDRLVITTGTDFRLEVYKLLFPRRWELGDISPEGNIEQSPEIAELRAHIHKLMAKIK